MFSFSEVKACAFVGARLRSAQPTGSRSAGFTLLEILLVLVLMGLAATMVMPRLATGSGAQELRISVERLQALSKSAHQMALVEGRSIGLSFSRDDKTKQSSYDFLSFQEGQWTPVERNRLLREVKLPEDLTLNLTPGASFWREALLFEESSNNLLEDMVTEAKVKPDIYFWSSGEISPAQIRICIATAKQCREIVMEETGEIYDRDITKG